jgi:bla regulator protein blaR1
MMRLILFLAAVAVLGAQSPDMPDWQKAAGGNMEFDVVSVKPTNRPELPSFPLDPGNGKPAGGRFSAAFDLASYINFAYKLELFQARALNAQLPKWATTDMYEIQAKAEGNPSKDQMRLMMQSLLADRFKLKVHFETREMPVFALTLVTPGKTGPKLIPHDQGPPCPDSFALPTLGDLPSEKDVFPPMCGYALTWSKPSGITLWGSRDSTPQYLAISIGADGSFAGEVDKPVVDRTGLSGSFDFTMEYAADPRSSPFFGLAPPKTDAPLGDLQGPSFLEAVRKQLGLRLVPDKGPVETLVVDHVERPSEN